MNVLELANRYIAHREKMRELITAELTSKESLEQVRREMLDLTDIETATNKDLNMVKASLIALEKWYSTQRVNSIEELQRVVENTIKEFNGNKHNLKLKTNVLRNQTLISLTMQSPEGDGREVLATNNLSGSERQVVGAIMFIALARKSGSKILIFDEAFNSFGVEEVAKLPAILKNLTDLKVIIVEHKNELFQDYELPTYQLEADETGTKIVDWRVSN